MDIIRWKKIFGEILSYVFRLYGLRNIDFSTKYNYEISTIKHWRKGLSFPRTDSLEDLKMFITSQCNNAKNIDLENVINKIFEDNEYLGYSFLVKTDVQFDYELIINSLQFCIDAGHKIIDPYNYIADINTKNDIKVIVFDFDGTLTKSGKVAKTTWENIWVSLGYDVRECQTLHKKFDRKEISHSQWCQLTEEKFKIKKLKSEVLNEISKNIELISGVERTFLELSKRNIKIYIVSGSILYIIKKVLGELTQYVDDIKANDLMFDKEGYLEKIIGTKFDFEGKAKYISKIIIKLQIYPSNVLFVGNSRNDQYVYKSGVQTLCINPRLTDITNNIVWNDYIETCNDLYEIIEYIDGRN